VDGINAILAAWKTYGNGDVRKIAHILVTPFASRSEAKSTQQNHWRMKFKQMRLAAM
jgi:hypothetical protein